MSVGGEDCSKRTDLAALGLRVPVSPQLDSSSGSIMLVVRPERSCTFLGGEHIVGVCTQKMQPCDWPSGGLDQKEQRGRRAEQDNEQSSRTISALLVVRACNRTNDVFHSIFIQRVHR